MFSPETIGCGTGDCAQGDAGIEPEALREPLLLLLELLPWIEGLSLLRSLQPTETSASHNSAHSFGVCQQKYNRLYYYD